MPLAHLVLAHAQPEHVARLVRRLTTPEDVVLVHIDRKADLLAFERAFAAAGVSPVVLERRYWVTWGGYGIVRATLALVRAALALDHPWTHAVLLSGADYPIRPTGEIQEFFAGQPDRSFLSWSFGGGPVVTDEERTGNATWYWSGDMERLLTWKVDVRGRRWHLPSARVPRVPKRRIPRGLTPAQGSGWWSLSREACDHLVRFMRRRPDVQWFFTFVFAADENVAQMVLLASGLRSRLVNEDLRYMNWAGNSPPSLVLDDLEPMLASKKLFARKFDPVASAELLDELDRRAGA